LLRILLVGLGGFIGSILRYLVSGYVQDWTHNAQFPFGTIVVNIVGCFVIGLLSQLAEAYGIFNAESRAFVVVGILGGFTTFSTFSNESINLFRDGQEVYALANISIQVILGLGAVILGRIAAGAIWR
jgi:CrcB protein